MADDPHAAALHTDWCAVLIVEELLVEVDRAHDAVLIGAAHEATKPVTLSDVLVSQERVAHQVVS